MRKNRQRERVFVVEGTRLFSDALEAGAIPERVFFEPERVSVPLTATLEELFDRGIPVHPVSHDVIVAIADTQTPQGIVAIFSFPEIPVEFDNQRALFVVADGIKDPGNLGSLMRSSLGAGVHALYVSRETVDPYSPKVVRAGMGAHFRLPLRSLDWNDVPREVLDCAQRFAAEANSETRYDQLDWTSDTMLIVGSEATGISENARRYVTSSISIPLTGRLESLNAAVAGAVILFEAARQRRTQ